MLLQSNGLLTLISTDKGFKGFEFCFTRASNKLVANMEASLTGYVYRVSHVFFSLSLASVASITPIHP
jgi:hypothetical protein